LPVSPAVQTARRLWWFVALLAVPAALAGIALVWPGQPAALPVPPAPPAEVARALPSTPAPVVTAEDPPPASPADVLRAQLAEVLAAQPIRFGADSAELAGPPADAVQRVAELLVAAPDVPVLVEGHVADTPGRPEAGWRLSERRAAVVCDVLLAAGVPAEQLTPIGLGAERPLASVEESRRVEITVG
jgi:outer membrane protein OmpA-like peptidoglycan-associated protein